MITYFGKDPRYDGENDPADLLLIAQRVMEMMSNGN